MVPTLARAPTMSRPDRPATDEVARLLGIPYRTLASCVARGAAPELRARELWRR